MLAKKSRLPIGEFRGEKSVFTRSANFTVRQADSPTGRFRLGVIVSKRVAARATERNRIRRIVFSVFEKNIDKLSAKDVLVSVLPGAGVINRAEAGKELKKIIF